MTPERPTQRQYDRLVSVFRDQLRVADRVDAVQAAAIVGIEARAARRSWIRGWTDEPPALLAIKDLFERERLAQKAKMARAQKAVLKNAGRQLDDAVDGAASQKAIEGFVTLEGLLLAQRMVADANELANAARPVRERLVRMLAEMAADPDVPYSKLERAQRSLAEYAQISMTVMEKAFAVMRKANGDPDLVIKHQVDTSGPNAVDDMRSFIEALKRYAPPALTGPPASVLTSQTTAPTPVVIDVVGADVEPLETDE